jgi:hypothetical protein
LSNTRPPAKTPDLGWYAAESSRLCLRRPRRLRRPETAYDPCQGHVGEQLSALK